MKRLWPLVRLGEVLHEIVRQEKVDPLREYTTLGVKWYAQGLFAKDKLMGHQIAATKIYRVEEGDFVYNRLFAWKGSFAVADNTVSNCYVSNEFPCFRSNDERLDVRYLHAYFRQEHSWSAALGLSSGATPTSRNRLKESAFLSLKIPLPPLVEQRRIVSRVDGIQQKMQTTETLRTSVEAELGSLFSSLHNTSGTECKLGDLIELHEDAVRIQPSEAYPQVGIRGFGGGLFPKSAVLGTETTYKVFNRLYDGAVVLSQVKGWEGAIAVCPDVLSGMYVSPEYRTFRCKPNITSPTYIQEVVRSPWFWKYLQEATRGVGARRERVRPEKFLAIELNMPSFERQKSIVAILNSLEGARQIRTEIQPSIDAVMPSVLQKVFG